MEDRKQGIGTKGKLQDLYFCSMVHCRGEVEGEQVQTRNLGKLTQLPCSCRKPPATETTKSQGNTVSRHLGTHGGSEMEPLASWREVHYFLSLEFLHKEPIDSTPNAEAFDLDIGQNT